MISSKPVSSLFKLATRVASALLLLLLSSSLSPLVRTLFDRPDEIILSLLLVFSEFGGVSSGSLSDFLHFAFLFFVTLVALMPFGVRGVVGVGGSEPLPFDFFALLRGWVSFFLRAADAADAEPAVVLPDDDEGSCCCCILVLTPVVEPGVVPDEVWPFGILVIGELTAEFFIDFGGGIDFLPGELEIEILESLLEPSMSFLFSFSNSISWS